MRLRKCFIKKQQQSYCNAHKQFYCRFHQKKRFCWKKIWFLELFYPSNTPWTLQQRRQLHPECTTPNDDRMLPNNKKCNSMQMSKQCFGSVDKFTTHRGCIFPIHARTSWWVQPNLFLAIPLSIHKANRIKTGAHRTLGFLGMKTWRRGGRWRIAEHGVQKICWRTI